VRRVVRQQLVDLGYPVIEAENGNQALEMIEQIADIAIVVSDVIMPGGINGRQLAARVLAERHPEMHPADEWLYRRVLSESASDACTQPSPLSRQDLVRAMPAGNPKNDEQHMKEDPAS
jgi:CheY-like chemotaxis protein